MKKVIVLILTLVLSLSLYANDDYQRYLKLGNTYLNACNYAKAGQYFQKGHDMAEAANDYYWIAVSYEYFAYLYIETGDVAKAEENLERSIDIYKQIIKQKDGSPVAVDELIQRIETLRIISKTKLNSDSMDDSIFNFDNKKIDDVFPQLPDNPTNLSLANCRIKEVWFLIDKTELQYLNLSNNRIKTIPPSIKNLENIVTLDLSNNRIKQLPIEELSNLKNLRVLNIKGNKLPFEDIVNLIRLLPNTNIYFDEYVLKELEEDEEY